MSFVICLQCKSGQDGFNAIPYATDHADMDALLLIYTGNVEKNGTKNSFL